MNPFRRSLLIFACVGLAGITAAAQSHPPAPAKDVFAAAVATAKAEHKNVLIHFGASWCSWCKHLDAMLESNDVGKLFHDNYVIAHMTIQEAPDKLALENPGAQEMVDQATGDKGAGVPVYIFFDSAGKQLATSMAMPGGKNIGHPASPEEIQAFVGLLEKTAPRMTAGERKQVADYLEREIKGKTSN